MKELIQSLEEKLLEPDVRKSTAILQKLLADSFIEVAASGLKYNRDQMIEALLVELPTVRWSLSNFQIRALSSQIILATYLATRVEFLGAKPSFSLRSSLWELSGDQWQMIYHQGTPVSE